MKTPPARTRLGARAVIASVLLVACAFGVVDVLPEPAEEPVAEPEEASRPVVAGDAEVVTAPSPCDKPNRVVTILVDGATRELEIFVECDPRPYRELGDPPPSPP